MNSDWRAFLESRGAAVGDQSRDGQGRGEPDCALVDLSHLGLIVIGGADATDFLQGQLSNDVRELSASHTQLSSHCSAKGRMLANFRVLRLEERFLLVLPHAQLEPLIKRLRMFVLRSQVTLEDASDRLVCFGVIGRCADAALGALFGGLPIDENAMAHAEDCALIRVAGTPPRYLFIGPPEQAKSVWTAAAEQATEANPNLWALHDIRAGLPVILPETSDTFVPQMTNMQLIDGVSFNKGCYNGQEVVARMQYLGKLKRRMYVAEVDAEHTPRPGDELSVPGSRSEQTPGRVLDARSTAPGRWELLVVVEIDAAEGGEVKLTEGGPTLRLKAPPYGFPARV